MTDVVVLGAGPAGLAASLELARAGVAVTLVEKQAHVGGNASSFNLGGVQVDYGSHRLHPASDPKVMQRIRELLGDELLVRPRHGRIRLMGRWIHFPLRPVDLLLRMHPKFAFGVAWDALQSFLPRATDPAATDNFASVLDRGLGRTICQEFYFPYSRKIWGVEPEQLSAAQAYKRVSAGSIGKMLKRLLPSGSGGGASTKGIFHYPRYGFGQICERYHQAALEAGVSVLLDTEVKSIELVDGSPTVTLESGGEQRTLAAQQVYSTIPLTLLSRLIQPAPPTDVIAATRELQFRSMVLVYLQLDQDRFSEYDAHYFPGAKIPFTRVSEPKNYSDLTEPRGTTVLCAEVPCFKDDEVWSLSEAGFQTLISDGLASVGLPIQSQVVSVTLRKIPFAYPLYREGYEAAFTVIDEWLDAQAGVLSFGRQGLYAHDNTHHAIYMAIEAVNCLNSDGTIDADAWKRARKVFESHVVED